MNIVIVGGGTAGWLAALIINKLKPEHKITVVESSMIGIVGAGEGSTGALTSVINNNFGNFDCNLHDFIKETGAGLKFGIHFKGWTNKLESSYLAPITGTDSVSQIIDDVFAYYHVNQKDKLHLSCRYGYAMENEYSSFNKNTFKFDNLDTALHFDAHKVGQYFKKIVLKNKDVVLLDDEVVDINLSENGYISSLILKNQEIIYGDFFIDASGFKRVLMNKLGNKWISYNKNLPVNSAMPFIIDYKDEETPKLWTTAWAQKAGWMWQIPTQDRIGCGYVFDDNFITPDQAKEEIEITLGHKIDPIKVLKFDTGRLENLWYKNVLAIGLAAAFAEPLEATSIHTTIIQLITLTYDFLYPTKEITMNEANINFYNKRMTKLYDYMKDFLVAHYMGGRQDSNFWKYISSGETVTDFVKEIILLSKIKYPSNADFPWIFGGVDWNLWGWILVGTNNINTDVSKRVLSYVKEEDTKKSIENYKKSLKIIDQNMKYKDFIKFFRKIR